VVIAQFEVAVACGQTLSAICKSPEGAKQKLSHLPCDVVVKYSERAVVFVMIATLLCSFLSVVMEF
jgi:hypothetical protein